MRGSLHISETGDNYFIPQSYLDRSTYDIIHRIRTKLQGRAVSFKAVRCYICWGQST